MMSQMFFLYLFIYLFKHFKNNDKIWMNSKIVILTLLKVLIIEIEILKEGNTQLPVLFCRNNLIGLTISFEIKVALFAIIKIKLSWRHFTGSVYNFFLCFNLSFYCWYFFYKIILNSQLLIFRLKRFKQK